MKNKKVIKLETFFKSIVVTRYMCGTCIKKHALIGKHIG